MLQRKLNWPVKEAVIEKRVSPEPKKEENLVPGLGREP